MPSGAQQRALIAQLAKQHGLDPHAVLAVASVEGGFNGAVGDQGTSFGPFQEHWGGAMPRQFRGNAKASQRWANSRAGIAHALDGMVRAGARGLKGREAIHAIVTKFERPAAPGAEVEKAFGRYGTLQFGGGVIPSQREITGGGNNSAATQLAGQSMQSALAAQLLAQAAQTSQGQLGDATGLMAMAQMRQQLQAAEETYGPARSPAAAGVQSSAPEGAATGYDADFKSRLDALIQASNGRLRVTSGFRPVAEQERLWKAALKKYGSAERARKWVAPPGRSNHGKGIAADLAGDLKWAHDNAGRFGLHFPMSWENWHIEPVGSRK